MSRVQSAFTDAAAEFHVPAPVLLAVGYQESWWESHRGQPSAGGGFGLMQLTDTDPGMRQARPPAEPTTEAGARAASHTLAAAAALIGADPQQVLGDDRQNIRAGAALLASYQEQLTGSRSGDPGAWYGAVARYSEAGRESGARLFADDVFAVIRDGAARVRSDGQQVVLEPLRQVNPDTRQLAALGLPQEQQAAQGTECPPTLDCRFVAAAVGNYQSATRPENGVPIDTIVIHDVEGSYDSAIATFQNPSSGVSAHYVVRSGDGQVTQMLPTGAIGFHAGNYWTNLHAIGIEHEGFAAQGATWYTPAMYHSSAALVRYLADRFHIPLDRQHIIGHDNVPGPSRSAVAGMHWDPGPYWDWDRYMRLLRGEEPDTMWRSMPQVGSAVTIAPRFADNIQTVRVCDQSGTAAPCPTQTQPSNFLFVRTGPGDTAPLFPDPAIHPGASSGTDLIDDWGDTIVAGQQFVVADTQGDWTAIWFSGQKVWFLNPHGSLTRPAHHGTRIVRPKNTLAAIPVYGTAYPQPNEYPAGLKPSTQAPLGVYTLPPGQAYVTTGPARQSDDYFTKPSDTVVTGAGRYLAVQLDHRIVLVNSADVDIVDPDCP
ncbi:N-acetylmuramoyl-L-alanine amidase [Kitasatospora sp. NPDC101176]|uniref:N-acetylmuramoyl-L-alanine amidase n=1 Tax=Kitasatospora sp. NPDC101176 TaxID=3364099 RepID=UPI0037FF13B6